MIDRKGKAQHIYTRQYDKSGHLVKNTEYLNLNSKDSIVALVEWVSRNSVAVTNEVSRRHLQRSNISGRGMMRTLTELERFAQKKKSQYFLFEVFIRCRPTLHWK